MDINEVVRSLPKALINWYNFRVGAKILFVSGGRPECEVLFDTIKEKGYEAVRTDLVSLQEVNDEFDYVVAAGIIERSERPKEMLTKLKKLLKTSGKLLLGAENRFAIRYFCGDQDSFSGHVLDGIDDYAKVSKKRQRINGGRSYTKAEYEKMLFYAGFKKLKVYAVMPELVRPQILLAENYIPNEAIDVRVFPQYNNPETLFLEEEKLYKVLMENHMFHQMANGFFIESTIDGELLDIDQITVQGDRGKKEAMATLVKSKDKVWKRALYPEGMRKIEIMLENTAYLKQHGIPMADAHTENGEYVMPYINGQIATEYFREILQRDVQFFIRQLEIFREFILSSSEHVSYDAVDWMTFEPWWENRKKDDPNIDQWKKRAFGTDEEKENIGVILKRGYFDMVSINCFHTSEGFIFFDQEFSVENFPANAIFIRTIDFIYKDRPDLERIYSREDILKYFKLYEHQKVWRDKCNAFLQKLRKEKELLGYHKQHRRSYRTIVSNRHRMDYSQEEYERLFTNIFKGLGSKTIFLFGSGRYAEKFIEQFGKYYDIAGIVDNNESRWGEKLSGIKIYPPAILKETEEPFKVFICIKFFQDVLLQLKRMLVKDISVYDPRLDYGRPLKLTGCPQESTPKKYHIGYVAGVFDLFHIGHLNIFRRAKEQCDYLIVGVVTDEQVMRGKKTRPYIPFDERLAIVEACKYVDEAVEIPADKPSTENAWYMYHFDVQFSGSDYADDPAWLAKKVFLQQHGSDLVFFPYTQTTSSTEIKDVISRKRDRSC